MMLVIDSADMLRGKLVVVMLAVCAIAAGCGSNPPAERVAACAAAKFGETSGSFTVAQRSTSVLSGAEYAITYQKRGSADRAIVYYNRVNGPVMTHQDISHGNHAEIKGAIEAIEHCALSVENGTPRKLTP